MTLNNCTVTIGQYVENQTIGTQYVDHQTVENQPPADTTPEVPAAVAQQERQTETFLWPTYTAAATDDDKRVFESKLREICTSARRSHSREAKDYLEMKQEQGLIVRPNFLTIEHKLLQKCFGYRPSYQAYHNA